MSEHRDPRSIITPDAFEVSAELYGTPLATPRRRAAALAIDGLVISMITLVTKNFALILGVVAAIFFVRAGFKRTPVRGSVFGRAMRISVGCLGVLIAGVTALIWVAVANDLFAPEGSDAGVSIAERGARFAVGRLADAASVEQIEGAGSLEEAVEVAGGLVNAAEEAGLSPDLIRAALVQMRPERIATAEEWEGAVDDLLGAREARMSGEEPSPSAEAPPALAADVDAMDDREASAAYAELLDRRASEGGDEPAEDARRRRALERRLAGVVAADTIDALGDRVDELERDLDQSREYTNDLAQQVAATSGGGSIFTRVRNLLDDLGIGFGWAALYLTIFLSWWNGQTVGKRLMGIRVVRLDGEPITWWVAFERAGGYAAGLATGLLGFAQVWWDANRQAIHDRIVGTVVVVDGAKRVENWEEAL